MEKSIICKSCCCSITLHVAISKPLLYKYEAQVSFFRDLPSVENALLSPSKQSTQSISLWFYKTSRIQAGNRM